MIYDFLNGEAAGYLKNLLQEKGLNGAESNFVFREFKNVPHYQVNFEEGQFIKRNGEDAYLMFRYLRRSQVKLYGFPKYHICDCITTQEYSSNMFYSNVMPVNITCSNTSELHPNVRLELCKNCIRQVNLRPLGISRYEADWYDIVLAKAATGTLPSEDIRSDGYSVYWKQISEAFRSKNNYRCQNCGIDLNRRGERKFLETHHRDGNKQNNHPDNLNCLCLFCHANVDEVHMENYSYGSGFFRLMEYLHDSNHKGYLADHEPQRWIQTIERLNVAL